MMGGKNKDADLWAQLEALPDDLLRADCPIEAVEAVLRDAGEDPEAVAERGAAFVGGLAKASRLSWRDRAQARLASMKTAASRRVRHELAGEQLRRALEHARASLGGEMSAAFRKHNEEEMTDEERRELLADMEHVIAMAEGKEDGGEDA